MSTERLLTVGEVAAKLRVSTGWVYQHSNGTAQPTLPHIKLGASVRFRESAIDAWLAAQEAKGNTTGKR
jgi:excisionase family DNA binding protein